MARKFKLTNDFHNTEAIVEAPALPHELSRHQARRVRRRLCPSADCKCGGVLGLRGPQQDALIQQETWNGTARRYTLVAVDAP